VRLENIGFIFQSFNLFPTLTAGENVELALDLKGQRGPAAKRRAKGFLEQVGIGAKVRLVPG
jgi:putative ABC transport system ATP-binding protein